MAGCRWQQSGADVAGVSPIPVADVAGVSPIPVADVAWLSLVPGADVAWMSLVPGADVAGVSLVPGCRCGRGEPNPGCRCGRGEPNPGCRCGRVESRHRMPTVESRQAAAPGATMQSIDGEDTAPSISLQRTMVRQCAAGAPVQRGECAQDAACRFAADAIAGRRPADRTCNAYVEPLRPRASPAPGPSLPTFSFASACASRVHVAHSARSPCTRSIHRRPSRDRFFRGHGRAVSQTARSAAGRWWNGRMGWAGGA